MARPLSLQVGDLADAATARMEGWERVLVNLGSHTGSFTESDFVGRELKAAAIVAAMAELEHFLREYLGGLGEEVNASSIKLKNLRASLRPLAGEPDFVSLANSTDVDNIYSRRSAVTSMDASEQFVSFPARNRRRPQPPLDGKTITGEHITRIWFVLGIEDSPFPGAATAIALKKLAGLRNDVAHRNLSLEELFRQPDTSAHDLLGFIAEVKLLFSHMRDRLRQYSLDREFVGIARV